MRQLPEEHAEMIRAMAKKGYPVDKIAFLVRTSHEVVDAILRGENPDISRDDEADSPLFSKPDGQAG